MNNYVLTIFYDGQCPLCSMEMDKLKHYDTQNLILLVNLHDDNFNLRYPHVNHNQAMRILHGQYQGEILLGLAVTHRAWTLVGKGFWVAPLNFPIVKQLAHYIYLLIAKYRLPISHFLHKRFGIGNNTCERGVCYDKKNKLNYRSK